jgi:hypothetical protein
MLTRLLTIVPLLLCPLLMLVCMWAMRGTGNRANSQAPAPVGQDELPTAARVAQLERELAKLRGPAPRRRHPGREPIDAAARHAHARFAEPRQCRRVDRPAMIPMAGPASPGRAGV